MKKKIYLIEPHSHVEVLYRWVQCLEHTSFEWEIITSEQNYTSLSSIYKTDSHLSYKTLSFPLSLPQEGILIFISLQTKWKEWRKALKGRTYFLTIHNSNTWFNPRKRTPFRNTKYNFITYTLKYIKSVFIDSKYRKSLLENTAAIIPYSSVFKIPDKFSNKAFSPPVIKQNTSQKNHLVVIPFYKSCQQYNISFLMDSLIKYQKKGFNVYILTNDKNRTLIEGDFHKGITFFSHPVSMLEYCALISNADTICYPIMPKTSFDIYSEVFGKTKYSGWLRDALEFSCVIDAPSDIHLESPNNLQTAKEYAHQFESQLDQLELL